MTIFTCSTWLAGLLLLIIFTSRHHHVVCGFSPPPLSSTTGSAAVLRPHHQQDHLLVSHRIFVNGRPTTPTRRPSIPAEEVSAASKRQRLCLWASSEQEEDDYDYDANKSKFSEIMRDPRRVAAFSLLMAASGVLLGPFLDSFHSAFGVLQYDSPITATLWGPNEQHPALITAWWVPELFGLAGFLIGWLYIFFDSVFTTTDDESLTEDELRRDILSPSPPKILIGISFFTFQYWLSGVLYQSGIDRTTILNIMSTAAACGFWFLDRTFAGFLVSAATALGGPMIEVALLTLSRNGAEIFHGAGYHYDDLGETGFFPLWIAPVYFLGGPANGNLARGYWTWLSQVMGVTEANRYKETTTPMEPPGCKVCNDTRRVSCPNWSVG